MVLLTDPTLHHALLPLLVQLVPQRGLLLLFCLLLVRNKLHPDLLRNHSSLRVRTWFVSARHSEFRPSFPHRDTLRDHFLLDFVHSRLLHFFPILIERVLGHALGVSLHLHPDGGAGWTHRCPRFHP